MSFLAFLVLPPIEEACRDDLSPSDSTRQVEQARARQVEGGRKQGINNHRLLYDSLIPRSDEQWWQRLIKR